MEKQIAAIRYKMIGLIAAIAILSAWQWDFIVEGVMSHVYTTGSILSAFGFDNLAFWKDVIGLAVFSGAFIIIAYGAMHFLLVEKR